MKYVRINSQIFDPPIRMAYGPDPFPYVRIRMPTTNNYANIIRCVCFGCIRTARHPLPCTQSVRSPYACTMISLLLVAYVLYGRIPARCVATKCTDMCDQASSQQMALACLSIDLLGNNAGGMSLW